MEDSLKLTCLYGKHVALAAKMSPFAGFMMPIQYTGITEEHLAVRNRVGMFDVSHMGEVFITGPDAEAFVNHIFTNDVRGLAPGKILYGMMLYPSGGVVDDLLVYRCFEADAFLLVINASNIDKTTIVSDGKMYKAIGGTLKVYDLISKTGSSVTIQGLVETTTLEVEGDTAIIEGVSSSMKDIKGSINLATGAVDVTYNDVLREIRIKALS